MTMRRVCIDTASNYFYNPLWGWLSSPEDARSVFEDRKLRFDAATAFILGDPTPYDFLNPHLFIEFLRSADEIITYNGRKCDFIVLEHAVSKDAMAEIWAKTHHDLSGWPGNRYGLRLAVSAFQPDFVANYDRILNDREVALVSAGVEPQFTASRLADTFRDALALSHLWAAYESSGDNSFTFRDAARRA